MDISNSPIRVEDIPTAPRERGYWVSFQLKLRSESYGSVGKRVGLSQDSIRQCLFMPSFRAEKALCKVLGIEPRDLFPERYGEDGRRLHIVRGRRSA